MNTDTKEFLRYFLPKGQKFNKASASIVCRHLHLAFKGKSTEEIYDVLMEQFLTAARRYDPHYSDKVKLVVETISEKFKAYKKFTADDVNRHLDFDGAGILRMLVRRGHLETFAGAGGRVAGYRRKAWPPPEELFGSGPIGFTYYLQWFRHHSVLGIAWVLHSFCRRPLVIEPSARMKKGRLW